MPEWRNGRRRGLKILRPRGRVSSTLTSGTIDCCEGAPSVAPFCLFLEGSLYENGDVGGDLPKALRRLGGFSFRPIQAFAFLFSIYLIALTPLVRADFDYIDDSGRVMFGYDGWDNFSRHVSQHLSHVVHASGYLSDISPLTQILAIAILSLAGLILIRAVRGQDNYSPWDLLAVIPIGLNPYFLECLSYKYDSLYMALSILFAIMPLWLIAKNKLVYLVSVVVFTLGMCMTYQAASGIFPMAVIVIALLRWSRGDDAREAGVFVASSALAYLAGVLIFQVFLMTPVDGYVSNGIAAPAEMVQNLVAFWGLVLHDLKRGWLLLFALAAVAFPVLVSFESKLSKTVTFLVAACVLPMLFSLTFGLYPALKTPLMSPRAMYGFGTLLSLLLLGCLSRRSRIIAWAPRTLAVVFAWCFVTFACTYGNALSQQADWEDFRRQEIVDDLTDLPEYLATDQKSIQLVGSVGHALPIRNASAGLPILQRLVPVTLVQDWAWGDYRLLNYYGLGASGDRTRFVSEYTDYTLVHESAYHAIYHKDGHFVIELR